MDRVSIMWLSRFNGVEVDLIEFAMRVESIHSGVENTCAGASNTRSPFLHLVDKEMNTWIQMSSIFWRQILNRNKLGRFSKSFR